MIHPRSKDLTFHLVGHAHIDPVWLWDWREGHETVKATFRSALDRLHENPDMVFVHSSAAQYAWMESHPVLLAEVRAAVERGQWEPVGGWWVEPDVNLAHGEALARQALLGQRTFGRLLGRRARVGFLPDSFGHPGTLPQLLVQSGLDSFVFMRPSAGEIDLPSRLFHWEGVDGTRILSAHVECYNSSPNQIQTSLERNLAWRPEALQHWVGLFGVGNHGGGPTRRAIANLRELAEQPDWPTLRLNSLRGFFDSVRHEDVPVYAGELQHHARGCYAAVSDIKRLNRQAEHALLRAEKLAVMARSANFSYPHESLTRAWQGLLFNQFHDILAGSSIPSAFQDAYHQLGEVLSIAGRVTFAASQAIADSVDTRRGGRNVDEVIRSVRWDGPSWVTDYGDGVPVLVFNPSSAERDEAVEIELNDWHTEHLRLIDDTGREVAHQRLRPESVNGQGRPRFVFRAHLPACGYRLYRVLDEQSSGQVLSPPLSASTGGIENAYWSLQFESDTGALRALINKFSGVNLLAGTGAQLQVVRDDSDTWGHGAHAYRQLVGVFGDAKLEVLELGEVRATVRATTRFRSSTAVQDFTLYANSPEITARLSLDWRETHHAAQLVFPAALSDVSATYEVPYGFTTRPADGEEEPVQSWLDVSGFARDRRGVSRPAGLALLNDSKYSASVLGGEIRLTLARSPVYAHHDPATLDPAVTYEHLDQGPQRVRWSLVPHDGDWRAARVPALAEQLNQPVVFTREYVHDGAAPGSHSALRLTGLATVTVSALKQAEDDDDLIVRLHEWGGQAVSGTVHLGAHAIEVELRPQQVLSLRITPGGEARVVNFLEEAHG
ncbi:alpha-mannosidase [Deinococcus peraridilitoris]|uniref:Alpha-mannosidase n=1 Tax=Deinococcus peraridilitoris (strain DSM 19664 / LMG 22246 / CIP 109416 / KR-200) TaxID=937777 RepID=K9ZY41_DEIPD|nr:glycoside hydrolase family 38 C-terminal domain-containing protein [Deinococcus peraridilitoris]AFZ65650.1 alpha-mannosidase [Deinococcus peraridilitoris DSM 19664]